MNINLDKIRLNKFKDYKEIRADENAFIFFPYFESHEE